MKSKLEFKFTREEGHLSEYPAEVSFKYDNAHMMSLNDFLSEVERFASAIGYCFDGEVVIYDPKKKY